MKPGFLYFLLITAVLYAGLSCQKELSGDPAGTVLSGPAEFSFLGTPGTCLEAIVSGDFVKAKLLDNNNTITVKVNVTRPGTYNISTTSMNGYMFTAVGSVNATGTQTIRLLATGTPLQKGTDIFTFNNSISSCDFPVTVTDALTNNDRFPLTANSYWIYDDLLHPGDTIKRTIADSVVIGGNMYKRMVEAYVTGLPQEYFFRKTGNDYFEYCSVDKYTSAVSFVPSINAPIPFLKENLVTGDIWKTVEYKGLSVATGKPEMLQYVFHCENADANIYINGKTYEHLYNVTMEAFTRTDPALPYQSTREINGYFYAKGIGIIYMKKTNQFFNRMEIKIRDWQVK